VTAAHIDAADITACADLVGRTGATGFEIGYLRDADDPTYILRGPGWYASALYQGSRVFTEDHYLPDVAADRLAVLLLDGGECLHCGRTVRLTPPLTSACRWWRAGDRWHPGCVEAQHHDATPTTKETTTP